MVELDSRNSLRRNWRNQSEQCRIGHCGRSGLYSRFVRRLGSSRGTWKSCRTSVSIVCAAFALAYAPAVSAQTDRWTLPPSANQGLEIGQNQGADQAFQQAQALYDLKRYSEALPAAEIAANKGDADGQVMAAHILFRGLGGRIDYNKAADYYRSAANQQHSDAYMGLGEMSLKSLAGLTPSDAMHWFSSASQMGRQDAMRAIGEMYQMGLGVTPDPTKAKDWLSRASAYGDALADRKMADSLFESNPIEAIKYYEKAADLGDNEAAYIAAIMYEQNYQIRPDSQKMAKLMLQAANGGHAAAQADYGLLVFQGRGVLKNMDEAAKWFEKSARAGDQEGQFLYAYSLAKGEGVTQNFEEAYYWTLKSERAGVSGVSDYDQSRITLRQGLETKLDASARARVQSRTIAQ